MLTADSLFFFFNATPGVIHRNLPQQNKVVASGNGFLKLSVSWVFLQSQQILEGFALVSFQIILMWKRLLQYIFEDGRERICYVSIMFLEKPGWTVSSLGFRVDKTVILSICAKKKKTASKIDPFPYTVDFRFPTDAI